MLLFSDGFECLNCTDVGKKWGSFNYSTGSNPYIISGFDSNGKPYATKEGKALYCHTGIALLTTFQPSRTIYAGFAFRSSSFTKIHIDYCAKISKGEAVGSFGWGQYPTAAPGTISTLDLSINNYSIGITQSFSGIASQVGSINTTMNMLSGDFHYIQVGMTLNGNVSAQPQAWIEVRVGNRGTNKYVSSNILTSLPDGAASYTYINGLGIRTGDGGGSWNQQVVNTGSATVIDDVYICNDEGYVNNSFLGNVKVMTVRPTADGTVNDGYPSGGTTGYRFQYVDEESPETSDYLTLAEQGDRQMLRFASMPLTGSTPYIYGSILHTLATAQYQGTAGGTALKGIKKLDILPDDEAMPTSTPLVWGYWRTYSMVFENDEIVDAGQPHQIWSPTAVNGSEFGMELIRCELNPAMYDPNLVRFNIVFEETVSEFLGFYDFTHRFYDELMDETILFDETKFDYEYTWKFEELLYWDVEIVTTRNTPKVLNETLEFSEVIPWTYLFANEPINFTDDAFIQYLDNIDDLITVVDWASGYWEELFNDVFSLSDASAISLSMLLDEIFGLEEPYLWDGHETIEEVLIIDADEPWDNHELAEEYLSSFDESMQGIGLDAYDEISIIEDHHDGNWVELFPDYTNVADSILTQHWRYEIFMGVVITSTKISPVEQTGEDGNKTGNYTGEGY